MSKKDVSSMVKGMGMAMSILTELTKKAKEAGLGDEDIHRLATPEGNILIAQLVRSMAQAGNSLAPVKSSEIVTVPIDYRKPFEVVIQEWRRAVGEFFLHPEIKRVRFPINGPEGVRMIKLALDCFDTVASNGEALDAFAPRRIRPAGFAELVALSTAYPNLQRRYPVVALGSVWHAKEGPCVLVLDEDGIVLGHGESSRYWSGHTRFLGVCDS